MRCCSEDYIINKRSDLSGKHGVDKDALPIVVCRTEVGGHGLFVNVGHVWTLGSSPSNQRGFFIGVGAENSGLDGKTISIERVSGTVAAHKL